jgi:two-component system OmpR family sensor kinase
VVIEDHGIGIPDTDREHVFERYYRGSNTSGVVGSGVGLYLVKTIIGLHQGSITLDSRESEGSRFTLRLPASSMDCRASVGVPRQLELTSLG